MGLEQLVAPIVSVGGLAIAMTTTYLTVRQYYDKRRAEDKQRQREELERLHAARQKEMDEYAAGKQKAYAAERDFNHLMRMYETLTLNLDTLTKFHEKEARNIEADLKEIKSLVNIFLIQVGQTESSVMRYLKREDEG